MARVLELTERPYLEAIANAKELEATAEREGGTLAALLPSFCSAPQEEARHGSRVALAGLAAQCVEFQRENGRYPSNLTKLPNVIGAPWSGKPFLLEAKPDGILIRSQGEPRSKNNPVEWKLSE